MDAVLCQRLAHGQQRLVLAGQHQHLARRQAGLQPLRQPGGGLAAFARAQRLLLAGLCGGEAVAPVCGCSVVRRAGWGGFFFRALDAGQRQHLACGGRCGGVRAKVGKGVSRLRGLHHGVDGINYRLGVAAGVVATEHVAAQPLLHELAGGGKHFGRGAAKAVDALLGVAHDEDAGRLPCARVALQPGVQRLPLQRVGVLEFINQQVAHLRIEPLLQPAAQGGVLQQHARGAFDVVHVDPAAAALELRVALAQQPAQACHALLVLPARVLDEGVLHVHGSILRGAHGLQIGHVLVELAWLALVGKQGSPHRAPVGIADALLQFAALGLKRSSLGCAQRLRGLQQQGATLLALQQPVAGAVAALHGRKMFGEVRHR